MNHEEQCTCEPPRWSNEPLCSGCGRRPFRAGLSAEDTRSVVTVHSHGVGAGGNISIGGDMVVGAASNGVLDNVVRTPMHRERSTKAILPDNWVTAIAGLCTIALYISNFRLKLFGEGSSHVAVILLTILAAGVLIASLYIRLCTKAGHPLLSPFASAFTYEVLQDGKIHKTLITAECPWCATVGRTSPMLLRKLGKPSVAYWVCRGYTNHVLDYDPGLAHIPESASERSTLQ